MRFDQNFSANFAYLDAWKGKAGKGIKQMTSKHSDDELDYGAPRSGLERDRPKDHDLLERLSAKLLRLNREAGNLAATMRQKVKSP